MKAYQASCSCGWSGERRRNGQTAHADLRRHPEHPPPARSGPDAALRRVRALVPAARRRRAAVHEVRRLALPRAACHGERRTTPLIFKHAHFYIGAIAVEKCSNSLKGHRDLGGNVNRLSTAACGATGWSLEVAGTTLPPPQLVPGQAHSAAYAREATR